MSDKLPDPICYTITVIWSDEDNCYIAKTDRTHDHITGAPFQLMCHSEKSAEDALLEMANLLKALREVKE
jgi:hypothetical protein